MKRVWFLALLVIVGVAASAIAGLASHLASAQGTYDSATPPPDYVPIPVEPTPLDKSGTIQATSAALIMDVLPWGSNALVTELTALGLPPTIYNSSALGTNPNIWNHDLIIVAEDQVPTFYTNLAANMTLFDQYLRTSCGVVMFNMSAWGWNGGNAGSVVLPGGVGIVGPSLQWNNFIVQATHPIATTPNLLSNPTSGTFASHAYFQSIGTASVIIEEGTGPGGNPTLIEYPFGTGHVIANTQTLSYGYTFGQDAGKLLTNLLTYAKGLNPCNYIYSVKLVCGRNTATTVDAAPVLRGLFATDINIHNPNATAATLNKRVILLMQPGIVPIREPNYAGVIATDAITLPPDTATMDDCQRIGELVYGLGPGTSWNAFPFTVGFLEIISSAELRVDAVYTTQNPNQNGVPNIEIEHILPQGAGN